jgi:hypothetical protein
MRRRIATFAMLIFPAVAAAEVLDRVAVTVGTEIISLSEVLREIRLSAFQDDRPADLSPAARRTAAGTLVDRVLVNRELELNRYPAAQRVEAEAVLEQTRKRFAGPAAYEAALRRYEILEEDLIERIQSELTVLRFIEFRFQSVEQPAATEVEAYYRDSFVPLVKQSGAKEVPPLEEVQDKIAEIIAKKRTDTTITNWLNRTRGRAFIQYHDGAFDE